MTVQNIHLSTELHSNLSHFQWRRMHWWKDIRTQKTIKIKLLKKTPNETPRKNKRKKNPNKIKRKQTQKAFKQTPICPTPQNRHFSNQLRLENLLPNYYVTSYWIELTNISSAFLCFTVGTALLPFGRTGALARLLGTALIDNFRAVN